MSLKNKVAVITGGAGVLCTGFARALSSAGAKVALLDLDKNRASLLAGEINAAGGSCAAFGCDVLSRDSIRQAAAEVVAQFGGYDLLLNGAGGNHPRGTTAAEYLRAEDMGGQNGVTFFDFAAEDIQFVFNLNILGTILPSQEFAKGMVGREGAAILNISSVNESRPLTKIPAYSGAKAAVSNFTKWLAVYLAKEGIRVNALVPGFFSTAQNKALLYNPDGSLSKRSEKILAATPMDRFGDPKELCEAALFLLDSEKSSFITGVTLPVDGGFTAYSGV